MEGKELEDLLQKVCDEYNKESPPEWTASFILDENFYRLKVEIGVKQIDYVSHVELVFRYVDPEGILKSNLESLTRKVVNHE